MVSAVENKCHDFTLESKYLKVEVELLCYNLPQYSGYWCSFITQHSGISTCSEVINCWACQLFKTDIFQSYIWTLDL